MRIHTFILSLLLSYFSFSQGIEFTDEPENLGPNVNSYAGELVPIISPDGKTLYVCRSDHRQNTGGKQSIWYSQLQADGSWGPMQLMHSPLNNNSPNWINAITPDGNTILLGNKYNYYNGTTSNGVSISQKDERGWQFPKPQTIENYENKDKYANYFLSNDGETLLMAIEKKKGHGDLDIWVSFKHKKEANKWTTPKNLGAIINTKGREAGMFLAADNKTLYFSSNGHPNGYGSHDIWVSYRLDDTWTNWSTPKNMGNKINDADWNSYFTIPASGEYAYFVSAKAGGYGNSDIYRIKLPSEAKPDPVVLVYGKVIDKKTNQPLKADITYELLKNGTQVGTATAVKGIGDYQITLPKGEVYGFTAKAPGYYAISENLDLTNLDAYQEVERNIYLLPIEKEAVIRLNNIFFEFGKATLKEESKPELNRLVKLLTENADLKIEISGHTDNIGSDADNLNLSQQRAESVVEYLRNNGIAKNRLTAKGYGESTPIADNNSDEGRAINRRVEFKVL